MTNASGKKRTDSASRVIKASPQSIYRAFVDPMALISWLPPKGIVIVGVPVLTPIYSVILTIPLRLPCRRASAASLHEIYN